MKAEERKLQTECAIWLNKNGYLYHYHLGNSRNSIQGSWNKGMGLQKGHHDLTIYLENTKIICIEFKIGNKKPSEDQIYWHKRLLKRGHIVYICRSVEEMSALIEGQ